MAEQKPTEFKSVEVDFDIEGNPTVKNIVPEEVVETPEVEVETPEVEEEVETPEVETPEVETPEVEEEAEEEVEEEVEEEEAEDVQAEEDIVDYDELPESVQAYLDFLEDNAGGTMEDFLYIQQDFSKLSQDDVIRKFMKKANPYLDDEDIQFEMESQFAIDPDMDTDAEIRAKKVAKKKYYGEAIKALEADRGKYKANLESSVAVSPEAKEALSFKQKYEQQQASNTKALEAKVNAFVKETNKVFDKDFKGFEIEVEGEKVLYKPENVKQTKEQNLNINNLLSKFTDKEGNVKDVKGYHRALTVASNPDGFAKHFYELGKAAAIEEEAKESKNIQMKPRATQKPVDNDKSKFKFVDVEPQKKGLIKLRNY